MAGRNMAANLGMNIDWRLKDPGMFNRGIENFSRPDADPTNMEEMQGLMEWQNKMGRSKEAALTGTTIDRLDVKATEAKEEEEDAARAAELARASDIVSQANSAVVSGDIDLFTAKESELMAVMQDAVTRGDSKTVGDLFSMRQAMAGIGERATLTANNITTAAMGALNADKILENPNSSEEALFRAKAAKDKALADPQTERAYRQAKHEQRLMEAEANEAAFQQALPELAPKVAAALARGGDIEALKKAYPQFTTQINSLIRDEASTIDAAARLADLNEPVDYAGTADAIDAMSGLSQKDKDDARRQLELLEKGPLLDRTKREQANALLAAYQQQNIAEGAAERADKRQATVRKELYTESLRQEISAGPSESEVKSYLTLRGNTKPSPDDIAEAQATLILDMEDRLVREEVRLGMRPPITKIPPEISETLLEDVQEEGVEAVIEELVREAYDRDAITAEILRLNNKDLASRRQVEAAVDSAVARVEYEDKVYETTAREYDTEARVRGTAGRPRPVNGPTLGERARQKLLENPFESPTLTPSVNKLRAARDKQNAGQGFDYTQSSVLDLFQGDSSNRRR